MGHPHDAKQSKSDALALFQQTLLDAKKNDFDEIPKLKYVVEGFWMYNIKNIPCPKQYKATQIALELGDSFGEYPSENPFPPNLQYH